LAPRFLVSFGRASGYVKSCVLDRRLFVEDAPPPVSDAMKIPIVTIALCAAAGGLLTSCVKVSFETEKAGRVFYETRSELQAKTPREESKHAVDLILVEIERRTVSGPNAAFNVARGAVRYRPECRDL